MKQSPLGQVVLDCGKAAGVDMSEIIIKDNTEIGTFYVIPEEKRVHYQRKYSAWAQQQVGEFNWEHFFNKPNPWLHVTGFPFT
jgi:hypothetical protein